MAPLKRPGFPGGFNYDEWVSQANRRRRRFGNGWGYVAHCSAKGGVNMLTKQLATEWAEYHINVNAIA